MILPVNMERYNSILFIRCACQIWQQKGGGGVLPRPVIFGSRKAKWNWVLRREREMLERVLKKEAYSTTLFLESTKKLTGHNLCEFTPIKQCQFTWTNKPGWWSLYCFSLLGSPKRGGKYLMSPGSDWTYSCLGVHAPTAILQARSVHPKVFFIKCGFTRCQSSDWTVFKRGGISLGPCLLNSLGFYLETPV